MSYVIFTDSSSVLSSFRKLFPSVHLVQEILDWVVLLKNRKKVEIEFCWVPSHVGVKGNERADVAAKAAAKLHHISDSSIPHEDFRNVIRSFSKERWQNHWQNSDGNFKLKSIRPSVQPWSIYPMDRRSGIILTRLRIGHTYITHKYLMASGVERRVPRCSTCDVDITVRHIAISGLSII